MPYDDCSPGKREFGRRWMLVLSLLTRMTGHRARDQQTGACSVDCRTSASAPLKISIVPIDILAITGSPPIVSITTKKVLFLSNFPSLTH